MRCPCEDSNGVICGKEMTQKEVEQDGMCQSCADNVWAELMSKEGEVYEWFHGESKDETVKS